MKIVNLLIENFRAIRRVKLQNLGDMIVIAGPNGCGKSCILDAIRLFKSVYGGYQPNEWQQWLGEFQINFQRNPQQMTSLLRSKSKSSTIEASIELSSDEIAFVKMRLPSMLEDAVWKTIVPGLNDPWLRARGALASELRSHKPVVDERVRTLLPSAFRQLDQPLQTGRLEIRSDGQATTTDNVLLEIIFSAFHPKKIGVIDYHGSHRNYGREELGGINLSLDQEEDRFRNSSLYNYANKYANIKSEMAAEYVRQALQEKADVNFPVHTKTLSDTLKELFTTFFPGKTFIGPTPTNDGGLSFPVQIDDGAVHDINDLSSGEKEVLFGYLRLRNSAPKYSVILLDEPELHLNPALVRGLPQFYYKNLGVELSNQIWLVTHSDAFLREAVGNTGLRVFHMQYASVSEEDNQIHEIEAGEEIEAIVLELVGDLAAYRPGAKVIFFEGEDSEFDLKMVSRLFPDLEKSVNFVSGGNRSQVERLHKTLEKSVQAGRIPVKIYSIVDRDGGPEVIGGELGRSYSWGVYHIENYLMEPEFICEALRHIGVYRDDVSTPDRVERKLKEIARRQITDLVGHKLRTDINSDLVSDLDLSMNPVSDDIGEELHRSVVGSLERMRKRLGDRLGIDAIRDLAQREREDLEDSLESDEWRVRFRGRMVLGTFAGKYANGIRYQYFRDLIVSIMVNSGYQPVGMKNIFDQIVAD